MTIEYMRAQNFCGRTHTFKYIIMGVSIIINACACNNAGSKVTARAKVGRPASPLLTAVEGY